MRKLKHIFKIQLLDPHKAEASKCAFCRCSFKIDDIVYEVHPNHGGPIKIHEKCAIDFVEKVLKEGVDL